MAKAANRVIAHAFGNTRSNRTRQANQIVLIVPTATLSSSAHLKTYFRCLTQLSRCPQGTLASYGSAFQPESAGAKGEIEAEALAEHDVSNELPGERRESNTARDERVTASHFNKAYKGRLAHILCTTHTEPSTVEELVRVISKAA